jgi:hypothetical protein
MKEMRIQTEAFLHALLLFLTCRAVLGMFEPKARSYNKLNYE